MNVTNHAKLRYVQRIIGIEDERQSRQYLAENEESVAQSTLDLLERAEHIWSGIVNSNKPSNFFIADDVVFVTDEPNNSIVTLFRCDFGFPSVVNKRTIRSMMNEIRKLRKKEQNEEEKISSSRDKKQVEIDTAEMQINALEIQLDILKQRRDVLRGELNTISSAPIFTRQEIAKVASLMVNSIEFRIDVLGLKKSV